MKVYMVTEKDLEYLRDKLEKTRIIEGGSVISCHGKPPDDIHRSFNYTVCNWFERIRSRETLGPM